MAKQQSAVDVAAQQRAKEQAEVEQTFLKGVTTLRDLIAPSSIEIHSSYFRLGTKYGRTLYVYGYPRQIYTGWLSSLINTDEVLDVSMYVYPVESQVVLNNLRKKVTQLEATYSINTEKGKKVDLYNTVSGNFIARNVSSSASIKLSPQNAAVIVCVPSGGQITYDGKKMLVNGIVVDYMTRQNN